AGDAAHPKAALRAARTMNRGTDDLPSGLQPAPVRRPAARRGGDRHTRRGGRVRPARGPGRSRTSGGGRCMTLAHAARSWVRSHVGVDVQRYPQSDPLHGLSLLLRPLEVDLVIDVGATAAGYARPVRGLGSPGRIRSSNPLPEPFAGLSAAAQDDTRWEVVRSAVGDDEGEIVVHVAGNDGASSSVLPMLDAHVAAAPTTAYVSEETVPLHRLDRLAPGPAGGARRLPQLAVHGSRAARLAAA